MFSSILVAQEYVYPLQKGTLEWRTLSVEIKNSMLQIPEEHLETVETEVLISAYINNPFCSLIFAYNEIEDGFNRVYNEFNGLRELLIRPGGG